MSASGLRKIIVRTRKRAKQGQYDPDGLPFIQVGRGRILLRPSDLADWLDRHSCKPMISPLPAPPVKPRSPSPNADLGLAFKW